MFQYIFQMPDIDIFILLSCTSAAVSLIAIGLIKLFVPLHIRQQDNAVIGNTGSIITVLYAVLAGLFSALSSQ